MTKGANTNLAIRINTGKAREGKVCYFKKIKITKAIRSKKRICQCGNYTQQNAPKN